MITLEALNPKDKDGNRSVLREQIFDQGAAEKMLRKSPNWRIKEGQVYKFKEGSIIHKANAEKPRKESKKEN